MLRDYNFFNDQAGNLAIVVDPFMLAEADLFLGKATATRQPKARLSYCKYSYLGGNR